MKILLGVSEIWDGEGKMTIQDRSSADVGFVPGQSIGLLARLKSAFGFENEPRSRRSATGFLQDKPLTTIDTVSATRISSKCIYVISSENQTLFQHAATAAANANSIVELSGIDEVKQRIQAAGHGRSVLVIDIETLGDTSEAVEQLLEFRRDAPGVPVILCSRTFARHDFSMTRSAIGDASVRLPCDAVSVALALGHAIENNQKRYRCV